MRTVPLLLIAEVRLAFRTCATQHAASRKTHFSTVRPRLRDDQNVPIQVVHRNLQARKEQQNASSAPSPGVSPQSKELVPAPQGQKSLDGERKVAVPLRVIPKAQITPNLTLSPRERLHLEELTRRVPPEREQKVYKKRLRIYSAGNARINLFTLFRFGLVGILGLVTLIVVPAHWVAGSSILFIGGVWLAVFVPVSWVLWASRSFVTEIFLQLPQSVQHSPKAAMVYAKSLPKDATLELRFMRAMGIPDMLSFRVADTKPAQSLFRPVVFEWTGPLVNHGRWWRPNPTMFYVTPHSSTGKAARDVTPGIWSKVYERLTGTEPEAVSRWRR